MRVGLNTVAGKLLASGAVLASAATVAGLGTFGAFTSTTSASLAAGSGTVMIALATPGVANRLNLPASGLVPGDTIQRAVDLSNTGTQALSSIGLTISAPATSSLLDTSAVLGLHVNIDTCATAWTETLVTAGIYTYTCTGNTSVLGSTPVIGTNTLSGLNALAAGGTDHLRVTLALPALADNTFQGLSSTLGFSFVGTQRVASAH